MEHDKRKMNSAKAQNPKSDTSKLEKSTG